MCSPVRKLAVALLLCAVGSASGQLYDKTAVLGGAPHNPTLQWNLTGSHLVARMSITSSSARWLAVGFNTQRAMIGTKAIIYGEKGTSGVVTREYSITDKEADASGINLISPNVLTDVVYTSANGVNAIEFTRPLATSDFTIDPNVSTTIVWAVGDTTTIAYHGDVFGRDMGIGDVTFASGTFAQGSLSSLRSVHGTLMFIAWGVLVPLGIHFAHFERSRPNAVWFKLHRGFVVGGFLVSLVAFVLAIVMTNDDNRDHFSNTHMSTGLIVVILSVVQMIGAGVRPGTEAGKVRTWWSYFHRGTGGILFVFSFLVILGGLDRFGSDDTIKTLVIVWYAVYVIVTVVRAVMQGNPKVDDEEESTMHRLDTENDVATYGQEEQE